MVSLLVLKCVVSFAREALNVMCRCACGASEHTVYRCLARLETKVHDMLRLASYGGQRESRICFAQRSRPTYLEVLPAVPKLSGTTCRVPPNISPGGELQSRVYDIMEMPSISLSVFFLPYGQFAK